MIIFQFAFRATNEYKDKMRKDIEEQIKTHPHFVIVPADISTKYYPETGPAEIVIRKEHEDDK